MKLISRMLVLACIIVVLASCSDRANERDIKELKIGILPDENKEKLLERYTPLFDYLQGETGLSYTFVIPDSYQDLLDKFSTKQVDLAYFGGFTFLKAYHKYGAVPLVMRDADLRFTSYFLARQNDSLNTIQDFRGKTFTFGSRLSTSGHLMPRYFLGTKNINPEKFFSLVEYSGQHDTTAYWVRDGKVDLGAANSKVIDKMYEDGRLDPEAVRIVWITPPFADYVWALQADINETIRTKIINAFLSLSPDNPLHAEILHKVDSGGFLPASIKDFNELDSVRQELFPGE